ncbi:MAG: TlyA family rRNA (cytidine-2'-O)-methyltransferase, partial [Bdellovibrionota bacterium]
ADEKDRQEAVDRVSRFAETLGLVRLGLIESPITGTEGNKEFLAHWKLKGAPAIASPESSSLSRSRE